MDRFSRLLEKIAVTKIAHADSALKCPPEKTEYGYGRVSGIYQGLCQVEQMMNDILKEDDNVTRNGR